MICSSTTMQHITKIIAIFLLFIILFIINLSNASTSLTPINGIEWRNVTDSLREAYRDDATGQTWITFKKEISPGNWNSSIYHNIDGNLMFKWKSDKRIAEHRFRSIKFYNNNRTELLESDPNIDQWKSEPQFNYVNQNNYILNFDYKMHGIFWIAFPPEAISILPKMPPNSPNVNISSDVNLWVGEKIWISANAADLNNDSINYLWDWGDETSDKSHGIPSGQNVTQCHSWNQEGRYSINITASNSNGANSSTINLVVQRRMMPTKPELNISSGGFLWLGNVLFISAKSVDPNSDSIDYSWDWGDETSDKSHGIPSGQNDTQCHSWNQEGNYSINITASNSNGANSSTINLIVLIPMPPEAPRGECIGYLDTNYTYETGLNSCISRMNAKFLFNWSGDGSDSCTNAETEHMWLSSGTKKVKVRALDIQGNLGPWSKEINIDIYMKRYVGCNESLQTVINNSSNYTELVLNCDEYNLSSVVSIFRKDHLFIRSSLPYTTLKNGQSMNIILYILDSNYINISKLHVNECADFPGDLRTSVVLKDSYHCKIKNCRIDVNKQDSIPLHIYNGGDNILEKIEVVHRDLQSGYWIIVENSNDNLLKNIDFQSTEVCDRCAHIKLNNLSNTNNNHIIKSDCRQVLIIAMNGCSATWNSGSTALDFDGQSCPRYIVRSINDTELVFI